MTAEACPHCAVPYPELPSVHVCADREPWTREEKDAWREQVRRMYPAISFGPSTQEIARRLGGKMRRELERL